MIITTDLDLKFNSLPRDAKILDAGGWFKPFHGATHVVDLMPWETREAKLQPVRLQHEKFTKETWYQVNFLDKNFRLPFEDNLFDFSVCSHTLEDLSDPTPLALELIRVSKAGYVEVPSRLAEQTISLEDGYSTKLGYHHHHFIIDKQDETTLVFFPKEDSLKNNLKACAIPLITYRKLTASNPCLSIVSLLWEDSFCVKFEDTSQAYSNAINYKKSLSITPLDIFQDHLLRNARKLRNILQKKNQISSTNWWSEIVKISLPYSSIPIE